MPGTSGVGRHRRATSTSEPTRGGWLYDHVGDPVAPSDGTLVVADATHAHSADNLALTQVHELAIQDATHGHTADNLALTQVHNLTIQDATHGHTADNIALTQEHNLTVADATHGHTADNLDLTQSHILTVADALHAHTADNLVLTQVHNLTIQDATHGHTADNLDLTQVHVLTVADALHGHTADNVVLTTGGSSDLVIQDATHGHSADNLALTGDHFLVIQDATHAHRATDHWDSVHLDLSGTFTFSTSSIFVDADASGDFWGVSDQGSMVYHPLPGPQVEQGISAMTAGGVTRFFMLRKSANHDSAFYALLTDSNRDHITTVWRDTDAGVADWPGEHSGVAWNGTDSVRARMVYEGGVASAYVSLAGGAWQLVGSRSVAGLTLVALTDSIGNPTSDGITFVRDNIILFQNHFLVISDATHGHAADHINDIGGEFDAGEPSTGPVRMRRRRTKMGSG